MSVSDAVSGTLCCCFCWDLELSLPWVDFALRLSWPRNWKRQGGGCDCGAAAGFDLALLSCCENPLPVGCGAELSLTGAGGVGGEICGGFGKTVENRGAHGYLPSVEETWDWRIRSRTLCMNAVSSADLEFLDYFSGRARVHGLDVLLDGLLAEGHEDRFDLFGRHRGVEGQTALESGIILKALCFLLSGGEVFFAFVEGGAIGGQFLIGKIDLSLKIGDLALLLIQLKHLGIERPAEKFDLIEGGAAALARHQIRQNGSGVRGLV